MTGPIVICVSGQSRFTACAIRCALECRITSTPSGGSGATGASRQSATSGRARSMTVVCAAVSTRAATARFTCLRLPPFSACARSASPAVMPAGKRSVAPSSNVTWISAIS